jgi:hypothetical protein
MLEVVATSKEKNRSGINLFLFIMWFLNLVFEEAKIINFIIALTCFSFDVFILRIF